MVVWVVCAFRKLLYAFINCIKLFVRVVDSDSAIEYSRKAAILAQFQGYGVIQMLPEEFSRQQRRRLSVDDYLHAFDIVRSQFIFKHRHFLFISGMCNKSAIVPEKFL